MREFYWRGLRPFRLPPHRHRHLRFPARCVTLPAWWVPGAIVTLTNEATCVSQKQPTREAGVYAFPAIPAGKYTVRVEASGFRTVALTGNVVQVDSPLAVDVKLEVGSSTETIQVTAMAQALQTSNATLGNVVEQRAIAGLPLNGTPAR